MEVDPVIPTRASPSNGYLLRYMEGLELGDHLAILYDDEDDHRRFLSRFIHDGLDANQRVTYITDVHTRDAIQDYLVDGPVGTQQAIEADQLCFFTSKEAYTRHGSFDPEGMLTLLGEMATTAKQDGFDGLRVTGEMSWALSDLDELDLLFEYEARLNELIEEHDALILCQYDMRRFDPRALLRVLKTHPIVAIGTELFDNFYYIPPEEFLHGNPDRVMLNNWIKNLDARKQAELELRRSRDQLEDRVQERTAQLAAYTAALERINADLQSYIQLASHDLQEPIRTIHTHIELLEAHLGDELPTEDQTIMDTILTTVERMKALIGDTVTFANLDRTTQHVEPVDLNELIDSILSSLAARTQAAHATIEVDPLPTIPANPRTIRILFQELIDNALCYHGQAPPHIEIRATQRDDAWHIAIEDHGEGIPEDAQARIFMPLYRRHAAAEIPGTGMGLPMVRRIALQHGGRIEVDSTPGEGATFTLTLPATDETETPDQPTHTDQAKQPV